MYFKLFEEHFKGLIDESVVAELTTCFKVKKYSKNQFFAHAGSEEDKLGFVTEGLFYMYIEKEDGSHFVKDFICEKQFLLATFHPREESEVSIKALKDSIVLEMHYSDFLKMSDKYASLQALAKKGEEKRLRRIYKKIEAAVTLEASERYRLFKDEYCEVEGEIPKYLVASYLGITPTQLSRIRKSLKMI